MKNQKIINKIILLLRFKEDIMDKKWDRLEGVTSLSFNIPKKYKVDFEKVNDFDDLKNIVEVFLKV